jgi:hypothetical protein
MRTVTLLFDALFALGGIAAFGFLAWGGWLAFIHSRGFVPEDGGRFGYPHGRRARRVVRLGTARVTSVRR